ncbi:SLBB domain-containing protein [Colwellia sp. MB02u-9]|uniref:SLBB domain-containing protein n=1 Tax=Colwellia sp. MB02u-9 TaxID=2759823 RepID=UPI0015F37E44|nr:SLBB domain-containing protein [Colwellia sp. MB02u-9]MBA6296958.1 SLBB domain-containing protein [Colwellia sp. MB02u-9]
MKLFFVKITLVSLLFISAFNVLSADVSQAQIEQFKQLSPSQQKALAKNMGIDISALGGLGNNSKAATQSSPSLNELVPVRNTPIDENDPALKSSDETLPGIEAISLQFEKIENTLSLKPFGYELFAGEPSTFAPVSDVPIPSEYVLGPGDSLSIQLYGKETMSYNLPINRQGNVDIPKLGPVNVAGQSFSEAKSLITSIIDERILGVKSNISMGELRSIKVFVLGEAYRAASYTLSSLSTVTQAIYAAGGINDIGSLRNIQVKRRGKVIAELDLYQLLLQGDTSGDISLMAGDVVFIPTVGTTVGIKGEVSRPAIYELKNEQSIAEVISLAGGVKATAYKQVGKIARINKSGLRSVLSVNLLTGQNSQVKNGDTIEVASVLSTLEQSITVKGHIQRPGIYGWYKNIKLSDILRSINDFKAQPDLEYILITRKNPITGKLTSYNVNFADYIKSQQASSDFVLQAEDTVYVFNKQRNRSESLEPLLEVLKAQTQLAELATIVSAKGAVRNPGDYPLTVNATVNDLLNAAMGYTRNSELEYALLARKDKQLNTSVLYIDLTSATAKNISLTALDRLFLFDRNKPRTELLEGLITELRQQADKSKAQNVVSITGDVHFPGQYPYVINMTSNELINLAGGLKESSYLVNADLVRFNHDGIENAEISHQNINPASQFILQSLDNLHIKRIPDWQEKREIELTGEVVFPGSYIIQKGETLNNVIQRAGGLTTEADASAAIFTRAALKKQEAEKIAQLQAQLESETAQIKLTDDEAGSAELTESSALLTQLNSAEAIGRLVIDLPQVLSNNLADIRLDDGDVLYIPKTRESISVIGEVQYATSHLYENGVDFNDYINRSGGLKTRADQERIYIIKADGTVQLASNNNNWFSSQADMLAPGDTIVIPLDLEYKDSLSLWSAVTQIIYNSAVAVAAIGSL